MAAPAAHTPTPGDRPEALSHEVIADILVGRRARLIRQMPRQIKLSQSLTADQREWIVDESMDYLVTENEGVIEDEDALERAFWKVANLRVRRTFEGRYETVRGGFHRVDVDDIELADDAATPEDAVVRDFERGTLQEFAAELSEEERVVLAVKYSGTKELGRFEIARALGRKPHEIRRSERSIARKLKAFSAIVAAGSLCDDRHESLAALALGRASELDHRRAYTHLERCSPCRMEYNDLVRAIRSGRLPREIGQILPAPALDVAERHRGPWEVALDWLSRPFGHDAALTAAQLAPAGRGLSALAGAKLLSICLGSTAAIGGYFCITRIAGDPPVRRPAVAHEKPRKVAEPKTEPERRIVKVALVTATPTRTPAPKHVAQKKRRKRDEVSRDATSHEKAAAISPPATTTDGAPLSEFDPGPANTAPTRPAAAPVNGGPEFP